jgi:hypothetical protein
MFAARAGLPPPTNDLAPAVVRRARTDDGNLLAGSPRPSGVTPGDLEPELRACLTEQAVRPAPAPRDFAGPAIRRVHRVRRRRTAGGAVALVAATTLASAGVVQLGAASHTVPTLPSLVTEPTLPIDEPNILPSGGPDPSRSVHQSELMIAPSALPVTLLTSERLVTAEGPTIDLKAVGPIAGAYGVPKGWLVLGGEPDAPTSLWHVRAAGTEIELLSDVDGLALSADGTRVAWRKGDGLFLAGIADGVLTAQGQTSAPAGGTPIAFVGDRVLLSRPRAAGTAPAAATATELGVWAPRLSTAVPIWRADASAAYGTLPDGRTVVARLADQPGATGQGCIGLLDAARALAVQRRACNLPVAASGRGWVSPGGYWLVAAGRNARAVLVDLSTAFDQVPVARDAGPTPEGPAVWLDEQTLVHGGSGRKLFRLELAKVASGDVAGVESIELSGQSGQERTQVVPPLRP